METYKHKATNLVAQALENNGFRFHVNVVDEEEAEVISVAFSVKAGSRIEVLFIVRDDDTDIAARVYRVVTGVPKEKCARITAECNRINNDSRHIKFCLDDDRDINVEYDFLEATPDEAIGPMALEIMARMKRILDKEYVRIMQALYTDEPGDRGENPNISDGEDGYDSECGGVRYKES